MWLHVIRSCTSDFLPTSEPEQTTRRLAMPLVARRPFLTVTLHVYHWGNSLQVEMWLSFLQKQTSIYRLQTWVSFHVYIYRYFARTSDKPVIYSAFVRFKCIRRYINGYTHRSCSIAISLKAPHKLAFTITVEIENLREMSPIVQRLFLNCAYNISCFGVFRRISVSIGSNGYCVDRVSR